GKRFAALWGAAQVSDCSCKREAGYSAGPEPRTERATPARPDSSQAIPCRASQSRVQPYASGQKSHSGHQADCKVGPGENSSGGCSIVMWLMLNRLLIALKRPRIRHTK